MSGHVHGLSVTGNVHGLPSPQRPNMGSEEMAVSASLGEVGVLAVRLGDVGALFLGDERPRRLDS